LIMCIMPNISVSPRAIKIYVDPRDNPITILWIRRANVITLPSLPSLSLAEREGADC